MDGAPCVVVFGLQPCKSFAEYQQILLCLGAVAFPEEEAGGFRQFLGLDGGEDSAYILRRQVDLLTFIDAICECVDDIAVQVGMLTPVAQIKRFALLLAPMPL